MIRVDINEFQIGQCEECGTYTYRVISIAEYSFYMCDKCSDTLLSSLNIEKQIAKLENRLLYK